MIRTFKRFLLFFLTMISLFSIPQVLADTTVDSADHQENESYAVDSVDGSTAAVPVLSKTAAAADNLTANSSSGNLKSTKETFNDYFPDPILAATVAEQYGMVATDTISEQDLSYLLVLNCSGFGISDMTGIEYLTGLTILDCSFNPITHLDLSHNDELRTINCSQTQIQSLNLPPMPDLTTLDCSDNNSLTTLTLPESPKLTSLDCESTAISMLDTSKLPKLSTLQCSATHLTELDVTQNPALKILGCMQNQLTDLDISKNLQLTSLDCGNNQLTSLELNNPQLENLTCRYNQIRSLDLTGCPKLKMVNCYDNLIQHLELNNPELETLICPSNQLTELDLSKSPHLTDLRCESNQLTDLDLSHNLQLTSISCNNNQLKKLDLSPLTKLTNLECNDNQIAGELDMSHNTDLVLVHCYNNQISKILIPQTPTLDELYFFNNQVQDFSSVPDNISDWDGTNQQISLPKEMLETSSLTLPVSSELKDENGKKMTITPQNGGTYNASNNTITWTNLAGSGSVSYTFSSTSKKATGTLTIPYEVQSLECDNEISYIQGTTKSAADFLSDIHAETTADCVLSSNFADVVNMNQPGDYQVTVTSTNPETHYTVNKTVTVHILPYTLTFSDLPPDVTFETTAVNEARQLIHRSSPDKFHCSVRDTRGNDAHWTLTATLMAPLTSTTSGDTLDQAFVYKNAAGVTTVMAPNMPVTIATAETASQNGDEFSIDWGDEEGFLLDLDTYTAQAETYETTITWSLQNTP
ncbi:leucine-rich repeat domain-containing protein [Listeria costaricensis]|uniref:leucine-rich repeat domain-containing protein n=1 Tax=Listeria costaricensis TaxID=2026604 RepID=UPI000C07F1AB|nr:leucine-rich repeat domain-containing protein [Listeria costaricensis]